MRDNRTKKRGRYTLSAVALAGTAGIAVTSTTAAASSSRPSLSYKGTISMYAGAYTPPIKGVKVAPGAVADPAMQDAANAFEKMYPGIKITFVPSTTANSIGTNQWYITEAAAASLPDVVEVPGYYVNVSLPKGIFEDLYPSFQKPNPYIPGNTSWLSTMNTYAIKIDTVPGNTTGTSGDFVVNGDYGGIGFFYNKKLFTEAGVSSAPTSWVGLVKDSQQIDSRLKSKGVYAGASDAPVIYNWFMHMFENNYLGVKTDKLLNSFPPSENEGVISYFYDHDGDILNSAKDPRMTAWWPEGKALIDTWDPKDYQVPENTSTASPVTAEFLGQQVAYAFVSGYSLLKGEAALPKSQQFPIGYFEITNLKGTSKYATNLQTWQDNGGPEVSFQYAISTPKADKSMTTAKSQAALAWLQFIMTPKWDSAIVNGEGNALPLVKGATAPAALASIKTMVSQTSNSVYSAYFYDSLTSSSFYLIDGLFLQYADGYVSLSTALPELYKDEASVLNSYNTTNKAAIVSSEAYIAKHLGSS